MTTISSIFAAVSSDGATITCWLNEFPTIEKITYARDFMDDVIRDALHPRYQHAPQNPRGQK